MSQQSENKNISIEDTLKILHSEAHKLPLSPTSLRYLQALRSLTATSRNHAGCAGEVGAQKEESQEKETLAAPPPQRSQREMQWLCSDWIVNMWLLGVPFSTASLNLDIISALYGSAVRQDLLPKTDIFSQLKAQLKELGPEGWKSGINEEIFARALRLTKNAHRLLLDDSIAADLMLLSLNSFHADTSYSPLTPIEQLALLPRHPDSSASSAPHAPLRYIDEQLLETVTARHAPNARKKYIFPLDQSKRSEAVIRKQVFKMTNALFKRARLPQATDPNQTIRSLWAYAALRTGLPASAVVGALGDAPLGLPILKLTQRIVEAECAEQKNPSASSTPHAPQRSNTAQRIVEAECAEQKNPSASSAPPAPLREKILSEVGKVFLDNPARWYAMSLRPGVRFTQVCRRIETLLKSEDSRLKTEDLTLFYPCEEIARAIGKKIVIKQRPFIHSVVFFKAKLTDIGPLFARIGDLAWCYRQSARPGAPYADISERQFRQFQQTIARFTPDYEVAPAGELDLKPNDRVEIVGGLFAGQTATVVGTHGSCVRVPSPEPSKERAAGLSSGETIYRLNIIGENGIEWRIRTDSRLLKPAT